MAAAVDRRRRSHRAADGPQPRGRQRPGVQRGGAGRVQHLHAVDLSHLRHPRGRRLPPRAGLAGPGAHAEHAGGGVRDAGRPRHVPRDPTRPGGRADAAPAVRRPHLCHAAAGPRLRQFRTRDGAGDLLDRRHVAGPAALGPVPASRGPLRPARAGDGGDRVHRRPRAPRAARDGAGGGGVPRDDGGVPPVVAAPGLARGHRGHGAGRLPALADVLLRAAVPAHGRGQGRRRVEVGQGRRVPVGSARAVRAAAAARRRPRRGPRGPVGPHGPTSHGRCVVRTSATPTRDPLPSQG